MNSILWTLGLWLIILAVVRLVFVLIRYFVGRGKK